jgi:hypothetical protein
LPAARRSPVPPTPRPPSGIAAGTGNTTTDNVVIDGLGGSIKFFATAVLFGRHGLWLKNTTGGSYPKFVYFEGGGFENGHGTPVLLDAGAQAQFANVYISADNEHDNVRINPGFTGSATFTGCIIRGCGRNGLDVASTRVTVTGCLIGNNGRTAHPSFARTISGAAAGPAGRTRVTTAGDHGWETGDRITVSGVAGTTEANGKWKIEVISPTQFDLPVTFSHGYGGGGSAYRHGAASTSGPAPAAWLSSATRSARSPTASPGRITASSTRPPTCWSRTTISTATPSARTSSPGS